MAMNLNKKWELTEEEQNEIIRHYIEKFDMMNSVNFKNGHQKLNMNNCNISENSMNPFAGYIFEKDSSYEADLEKRNNRRR